MAAPLGGKYELVTNDAFWQSTVLNDYLFRNKTRYFIVRHVKLLEKICAIARGRTLKNDASDPGHFLLYREFYFTAALSLRISLFVTYHLQRRCLMHVAWKFDK